MLKRIVIEGVKNIEAMTITLTRFAVLVGQASRGKTSVLDAVRLLLGCATGIETRGNARIIPFMRTGQTAMSVGGEFTGEEDMRFVRTYTGRDRVTHTFKCNGDGGVEEAETKMAGNIGEAVFDTRTLTDFDAIARIVSVEAKADRKQVACNTVMAVLEAAAKVPAGTYDMVEPENVDALAAKLVGKVETLKPVPLRFVQVASYEAANDSVERICEVLRTRRDEAEKAASDAYARLRQANAQIETQGATMADNPAQPVESLAVLDARLKENRDREAELLSELKDAEHAEKQAGKQKEDREQAENAVNEAEEAAKKTEAAFKRAVDKLTGHKGVTEEGLDALRAVAKNKRLCDKCKKAIAELVEEADDNDKERKAKDKAAADYKAADAALNKARGKLDAFKNADGAGSPLRATESPERIREQLAAVRNVIATTEAQRNTANDREQRKKQAEEARVDAVKAKAERAAMQAVVTAIEAVWAGVVKLATEPFLDKCNATLEQVKGKVQTLARMGTFALDYTGGKMRFAVEANGQPVLYHTMGGTERVVVRNIVGCTVLEYRIAAGAARMGILLDDIAEVSDEALVPFLKAMVDMTATNKVQCLYATCHGCGREKEITATGAQVIEM